jgi:hypothetical protein
VWQAAAFTPAVGSLLMRVQLKAQTDGEAMRTAALGMSAPAGGQPHPATPSPTGAGQPGAIRNLASRSGPLCLTVTRAAGSSELQQAMAGIAQFVDATNKRLLTDQPVGGGPGVSGSLSSGRDGRRRSASTYSTGSRPRAWRPSPQKGSRRRRP